MGDISQLFFKVKVVVILLAVGYGLIIYLIYKRIRELMRLRRQYSGITKVIIELESGLLASLLISSFALMMLKLFSDITIEIFQYIPLSATAFYASYGIVGTIVNILLRIHIEETLVGLGLSFISVIFLSSSTFNHIDVELKVFTPLFKIMKEGNPKKVPHTDISTHTLRNLTPFTRRN